MRRRLSLLFLACVVFGSTPVHAVKLYKVTRPDGTVMYQGEPPKKGSDIRVEEKVINPNANVVPIEQFPMDGEYTVPEGPAGSLQPPGSAARSKVTPLLNDETNQATSPPAPSISPAKIGGR